MDIDLAVKTDNDEQLQVEDADDLSALELFNKIFPLTRDTDGSCTAEYVSRDLSAEPRRADLAVVKEKPDDVCYVVYET